MEGKAKEYRNIKSKDYEWDEWAVKNVWNKTTSNWKGVLKFKSWSVAKVNVVWKH